MTGIHFVGTNFHIDSAERRKSLFPRHFYKQFYSFLAGFNEVPWVARKIQIPLSTKMGKYASYCVSLSISHVIPRGEYASAESLRYLNVYSQLFPINNITTTVFS